MVRLTIRVVGIIIVVLFVIFTILRYRWREDVKLDKSDIMILLGIFACIICVIMDLRR